MRSIREILRGKPAPEAPEKGDEAEDQKTTEKEFPWKLMIEPNNQRFAVDFKLIHSAGLLPEVFIGTVNQGALAEDAAFFEDLRNAYAAWFVRKMRALADKRGEKVRIVGPEGEAV